MRLFSLDISFDKDGSDLINIWESFDLVVGDGSHQGGLTAIVGTEQTITLTTLQLHLSVVQQNLGTVGKCKCAVAKLFCVVVFVFFFGDDKHFLGFDTDLFSVFFGLGFVSVGWNELTGDIFCPLQILHEMKIHHGCRDGRGVRDDHGNTTLVAKFLLEGRFDFGDISTNRHLLVSKTLEAVQLGDSTFCDFPSLGVRDTGSVLLQSRQEEGEERSGIKWVINKFTHVVDNDGRLAFGCNLLLSQTTQQQRHNHGKGGRFDSLDKCHTGHLVHDFRHFLWISDGNKDFLRHVFNITVANNIKSSLHGVIGGFLYLLLSVPHTCCNLGHNLRESISKLLRSKLSEHSKELECTGSDLPLDFNLEVGENLRQKRLDTKGVHVFDNRLGGISRFLLNVSILRQSAPQCCCQTFLCESLGFWAFLAQSRHSLTRGNGFTIILRLASSREHRNVGGQSRLFDAVLLDSLNDRVDVVNFESSELCFERHIWIICNKNLLTLAN
mmetsp:Transcript_22520/g.49064  ORF Transcript_22520/g.49064 Transcript_22520/m.49064 type:complete len:497 (+) Transcript_22520:1772-3262(+)